jgi:predicted RNA-binding protein with RPS1 domain
MSQSNWDSDIRNAFPDWLNDAEKVEWPAVKCSLRVGQILQGKVIAITPFGVWLDIGVNQPALLRVVDMISADTMQITMSEYPQKGTELKVRVVALGNVGEIILSQQNLESCNQHDESM